MKVIKSILIAVVLGIVYVGIGLMKIDNIKMSEILLANTMSGVEFYPQYISTFSFELLLIHISHFSHDKPSSGCKQFIVLANTLAVDVFPVPLGPVNK